MNFKTTLILLVVAAVLGVALWTMNLAETSPVVTESNANVSMEKPLLTEDFGEPKEITLQRRDGHPLVFTFKKGVETKDDRWEIAGANPVSAAKQVLDGISRRIKSAKVKLTYEKGAAGAPSLAEADLDPARESITMKNEAGKSVKVDIGRSPDDSTTYVRLDGGEDVLVVSPGLKDLLKKKDAEYRDVALYSFDKSNAYQIEVVDHSAATAPGKMVLVKTGNEWSFKEPFEAAANQKKINDLVAAVSNLRVANWVEGTEADAGVYGLKPPAVSVSVLVEEKGTDDSAAKPGEPESGEEAAEQPSDDAAKPKDEVKAQAQSKTYTVHLSTRGPLGEDGKVYMMTEGDAAFATVMKSTADKLMPKGSDWRELKLFSSPVAGAERLTITNAHGSTTLEKSGAEWRFAEGEAVAEAGSVKEVLAKLGSLEALGFVEGEATDSQAHGFQAPQATVEIKLPGKDTVEQLEIGDFTDAQAKRLVYARRSGAPGVAKVRVDDIAGLLKPGSIFRDRKITDIAADQIKKIHISGIHPVTREPYELTLADRDGALVITEPAEMPTDTDKTKELADLLSKLSAEEVLPDDGEANGELDKPDLKVVIDYADETSPPEPTTDADPAPSPIEVVTISFSTLGESVYAIREGGEVIYRLARDAVTKILGEYRNLELFAFDEADAKSVTITTAESSTAFEKRDNKWAYVNEPLLPIDGKKVDSLVAQIKALKPDRYAAYGADLSKYGLDSSARAMSITVKTGDDQLHTLDLAAAGSEYDADKRLFAVLESSSDVILLPSDTLNRFKINIAEYEPTAKAAAPKPPIPPVKP